MHAAAYWGTLVCLAYMLAVFAMSALVLIVSGLDNVIRSRETLAEDFGVLGSSRFSPPVSVIVPAYNEEGMVMTTIRSVLAFEYSEFEVIVVDDGSTDRTFDVLERELDLEPFGYYERRIVECAPVTGVYRSRTYEQVKVIRKENQGTKADASNCGLNFARYRYVLLLDGDTLYEPDALLNCMRLMASDPQRVIGMTGHISVASQPEKTAGARQEDREVIDATLLSNFQHLEYLRSFLNTRLGWSRLGFMMCVSGAFGLWRRDVVEEVGGWSTEFSCEDIELTFRVHEHMLRTGRPYRILSIPEMVARTEAPGRVRALVSQRARWQRVILETFWSYRRMILNPRYGFVGLVGIPVMLLSEGLGLVFELLGIATLVTGIVLGIFSWQMYVVFFGSMCFALAVLTSAAVLMEDISTRAYRLRHIARLLALGPLELVIYRPILLWARYRGTVGFLRSDKGWDKFDRNERSESGLQAIDLPHERDVTHAA
jgi:poly-beta-1,6-N-acetyl-D-glucosamine synthase